MNNPWVYASDLRIYGFCSRRLYLKRIKNLPCPDEKRLRKKKEEYLLRKRLYLQIPHLLEKHFQSRIPLRRLVDEDIDLSAFLALLEHLAGQGKKEEVRREFSFSNTSVFLSSPELGLRGLLDALQKKKDSAIPYLFRGKRAPRRPYLDEKLQLTSYALLLEKSGFHVPYGFIVYLVDCDRRPVDFERDLREETYKRIDKIKDLFSFSLPRVCPHGSGKKCMSCSYNSACYLL